MLDALPQPALSPWLAEIIARYPPAVVPPPKVRQWQLRPIVVAAALAIIGTALWPILRAAYHAGYPSEPLQARALEACSREDPSFIRFLPSARDSCYARYGVLLAGGANAAGAAEPAR
jgi:hypothetical protein